MIRMLLDGMLSDIGYTMTAEAGALDEAMALAKQEEFDVAILDVNLNGEPITPVAEILIQRGLPFVFATGDDLRGVPQAYRAHPTLQKPFQVEALERALQAVGAEAGQRLTRHCYSNSFANFVTVGSSVRSSLSGVTAMQRSSSAARSEPSGALVKFWRT